MLARCLLSFSLLNCVKAEAKDSCSGHNHMVIYKDINIKENNIGGKQRPIYDGEECADECLKTAGCKGFTMAKYGAYRGCWIKASTKAGIVKVAPQANLVSGVLCDGSTAKSVMPDGGSIYPEPNPNEEEWSEWSEETCSASCGPGTKKRKRTCEGKRRRRSAVDPPQISRVRRFFFPVWPPGPPAPKPTCEGKSEDIVPCNLKKCPAWSNWGEYSDCSTTCGPGSKKRLRTCENGPCDGDPEETAECNIEACSDSTDTGEWSEWSDYSTCSVTCGPGQKKRSRTCEGKRKRRSITQPQISRVRRFFINPWIPLPGPVNPVKPTCSGKSEESVACNMKECDPTPTWGGWGSFGPCSTKCGPGHKIRKRKCENGTFYDVKNQKIVKCDGKAEEKELCNIKPCEGPAWTAWTEWSECSRSCASRRAKAASGLERGHHRRTRTCEEGGKEVDRQSKCGGVHYDTRECENTVCQDDPVYVCGKNRSGRSGTFAIWTNKEFIEHKKLPGEKYWRPWIFTMTIGQSFHSHSVQHCASMCARRGWAPDGCMMFNFRAPNSWSNKNKPLFQREGKCTLFKDVSKYVQLVQKYQFHPYGEQYQVGVRCESFGKVNYYSPGELWSPKSTAYTPGGIRFDPCDPRDKFYPNGGCSDICERSRHNQNTAECSCPKGKTLVDKKNCAVGKPVKVETNVKLGTPFTEKLNDSESQEFKDLANDVIKMTKPALEETAKKNNAKVSVEVKRFHSSVEKSGRRRRDEDVPAAVADVEAKFFSSEKELEVDQESLKKDAESGLKEMEEIILSETDPNAEVPQFPETKELEVPPEIDFVADTAKHCPSSDCWIYEENDEGERACRLKTDAPASCPLYLGCKPATMDFRFNFEKLLGENDVLVNDEKTCEIENSDGPVGGEGGVDPTGADKMWKHAPASCDSEISRETKDDLDYIVVKKSFIYKGDNAAKTLGGSSIFLDDAATVTVEVCCRFLASHTAKSGDIAIEAGAAVEGKLEAEGSWRDSLKIEFTTQDFSAKLASDHVTILGETLRVKVTWTVGDASNNPIAQKLNWYISDCTLSDVTDAAKSVQIIQNQCFAGAVETTMVSTKMQSTENFKFSFLSFSFNSDGSGTQRIACDINFCLTATECSSKTDLAGLSCNGSAAHEWRKP